MGSRNCLQQPIKLGKTIRIERNVTHFQSFPRFRLSIPAFIEADGFEKRSQRKENFLWTFSSEIIDRWLLGAGRLRRSMPRRCLPTAWFDFLSTCFSFLSPFLVFFCKFFFFAPLSLSLLFARRPCQLARLRSRARIIAHRLPWRAKTLHSPPLTGP